MMFMNSVSFSIELIHIYNNIIVIHPLCLGNLEFLFRLETCKFTNGDVKGGEEEEIGFTNEEQGCALLVKKSAPDATGVSWSSNSNQCYAEYGNEIITSTVYRACLF